MIVDQQLDVLTELQNADLDPIGELEYWQVIDGFDRLWQNQKAQLSQRIEQARSRYEDLLLEIADH